MNDQSEAINKKRQEWVSAVNAGDIKNYVSLLAENIVWFPLGQQIIRGKQKFRRWLKPFFEKFHYEFSLSQIQIKIIGEWAIERGVFTSKLTPKTGGEMVSHTGNYTKSERKSVLMWQYESCRLPTLDKTN